MNREQQLALNLGLIGIISLIAIGFAFLSHNAHADSITTDQSNYQYGDTIQVSASFANPATIKILNPDGDLVYVLQSKTSSDTFEKNVLIMGPLWNENGTYSIQMISGGIESDTSFGLNAHSEARSFAQPSFGISDATNPTLSFDVSNATNPTFGDSNATNPVTDISKTSLITTVLAQPIPTWVKGVFAYWEQGKISDQELVNALEFLIKSGIIVLN